MLAEHFIRFIMALKQLLIRGRLRLDYRLIYRNTFISSPAWGPRIVELESETARLSIMRQTCFRNSSVRPIFTTKSRIYRKLEWCNITSGTYSQIMLRERTADNCTYWTESFSKLTSSRRELLTRAWDLS